MVEGMRFCEVIDLLIEVVDVTDADRGKVEGRFRSYRTAGVIPEFGSGTGTKASYSLHTAWKVAILFEFSTLGIPIEKAMQFIQHNDWAWREGVTPVSGPWILPGRTSAVFIDMDRLSALVLAAWKEATKPSERVEPRIVDRIDVRSSRTRKKMEAQHG